jgi:hypothetical protein
LELLAVEVELLDRQRPDDRAEGSLEDVLDDRIDLFLLGIEEPLCGVANRLVVRPDLERRHALDRDLDPLPRDGVCEVHVDLPRRELQLADLVEERQDDDALAADDLEPSLTAAQRRRPARSDERLVRAGNLVAAAEVCDQQDDDDDREEDDECPLADEPDQITHDRSLPQSTVRRRRRTQLLPGSARR